MAPVLTKSGVPSNRREKIPEGTLCVVCGDLASGIHYSVASCNGCKTFFRRALVNKQTFTCQFNGECLVGKNVRCVCRSCRLKKCFESGMDPKAIQHDRDKIRYTKVLKRQKEEAKALAEAEREKLMKVKEEMGSPGSLADCIDQPCSSNMSFGIDFEVILGGEIRDDLDSTLGELMRVERRLIEVRNLFRADDQVSTLWNMYIGSRALMNDDDWLSSVTRIEPIIFNITDRDSNALAHFRPNRLSLWEIREWFQRDLTLMMEWAKLLPGASSLSVDDRVTLQKAFALNYVVFNFAFYTTDTTVLAATENVLSADQITLEEMLRGLKRPHEPLPTPPPPAPTTNGFMNLPSALYPPLVKRIREEIRDNNDATCSAYLRKLTENFTGTPIATTFAECSSNSSEVNLSNLPAHLLKNSINGVNCFAERLHKFASTLPPLLPTMATGFPGQLSVALAACLHKTLMADPISSGLATPFPSLTTPMPVYPAGFFTALAAASPGSLTFPQSPLLAAASPLIAPSPLLASSPLMPSFSSMPSVSNFLPSLPSVALTTSESLFSQLQMLQKATTKEKTPEEAIDVETVSIDGRMEGKGSHSMDGILSRTGDIQFRVPIQPKKSVEMRRDSPPETSRFNPAILLNQPCSSTSSMDLLSSVVSPKMNSPLSMKPTEVKEEPPSPYVQISSVKSSDGENGETTLLKNTAYGMEEGEKTEQMGEEEEKEEDEDAPSDPTPEAMIMNRLTYPDGNYLEKDGLADDLHSLLIEGIWKQFRKLEVDQETFVLYKMMVFFNTELTQHGDLKLSEEGVKTVQQMRQKMYVLLMLHLQRTRGKDGVKVFANLLLLVTTAQRVRSVLRNLFSYASIFVPSNDLVDQLILRDYEERVPSPSAFRPYHPTY